MKRRTDYTFKYNVNLGRHGWLRLTPAYSVKLVEDILNPQTIFSQKPITSGRIFDPFCGTATTGIVAAEHGLDCTLYEINPFLFWFATAKSASYKREALELLMADVRSRLKAADYKLFKDTWIPPMRNIERWWSPRTLVCLGKMHEYIRSFYGEPTIDENVNNLLWISFARLIIECSAADYGHVSVSFKDSCDEFEDEELSDMFLTILQSICDSAKKPLAGNVRIINGDSRDISLEYKVNYVITSPPYPNRISYIRELRPYMYWLGFLNSGEEAGELDWLAIGGTWGSATSKLSSWKCSEAWNVPDCLGEAVFKIKNADSKNGKTLSQYVLKFFYDIHVHLKNLSKNLDRGCELYYVLGNSSFYGNMVHTDVIVCEILRNLGYENPQASVIRKRNSKKELLEFMIKATWA